MASKTFVDFDPVYGVVDAAWLNDADALVYDIFNGSTSVAGARTALGLGTADSVVFNEITGTLLTAAQPNITSLGIIASLVATTADINAGTVDAVIGGTTPQAGTFTTLTATGAFTSLGIDDNATSTQLTISDTTTTFGNDVVVDKTSPIVSIYADTNDSAILKLLETGAGDVGFKVEYRGSTNNLVIAGGNASYTDYLTINRDTGNATFSGDITVSGQQFYLGVDDTTYGHSLFYGNGTGSTQGGRLDLYSAADHDTTVPYWITQNTSGIYQIYASGVGSFLIGDTALNATFGGDVTLDSSNAEINLKSGVGGTTGALNFTFNTASTNYGSINLPYDTRASLGMIMESSYPLTFKSSSGTALTLDASQNATFGGNVSLADGKYLQLGDGNDVKISHSGTSSAIDNYTGRLYIGTRAASQAVELRAPNSVGTLQTVAVFGGATPTSILYYNTVPVLYTTANGLNIYPSATTETVNLQLGTARSGNGYAYIDLIGDATYTDYGLRIQRSNSGANTTSVITHRGTGNFNLSTTEAANIGFLTTNALRGYVDSGGGLVWGSPTGAGKGVGTINATGLYENGTALSSKYAPGALVNRAYITNVSGTWAISRQTRASGKGYLTGFTDLGVGVVLLSFTAATSANNVYIQITPVVDPTTDPTVKVDSFTSSGATIHVFDGGTLADGIGFFIEIFIDE